MDINFINQLQNPVYNGFGQVSTVVGVVGAVSYYGINKIKGFVSSVPNTNSEQKEYMEQDVTKFNRQYFDDASIDKSKGAHDDNAASCKIDPSYIEGGYTVNSEGRPVNPYTIAALPTPIRKVAEFVLNKLGVKFNQLEGRGLLWKWGPNQAGDPLVITRKDGKAFVLVIHRMDGGGWALPGGFIDPKDTTSLQAITRELGEETSVDLKANFEEHSSIIYRGYVDDPRNTENAWVESTVASIELNQEEADKVSSQMRAGDDAKAVKWLEISDDMNLYASHKDWVLKAVGK